MPTCLFCGNVMNFKHMTVSSDFILIYFKCPYCCWVCWFEYHDLKLNLPRGTYRYKDLPSWLREKFYYKLIPENELGREFRTDFSCPLCNVKLKLWKVNPFEYEYDDKKIGRTDYLLVCPKCSNIYYFGKFRKEKEGKEFVVETEGKYYYCPFCKGELKESYETSQFVRYKCVKCFAAWNKKKSVLDFLNKLQQVGGNVYRTRVR